MLHGEAGQHEGGALVIGEELLADVLQQPRLADVVRPHDAGHAGGGQRDLVAEIRGDRRDPIAQFHGPVVAPAAARITLDGESVWVASRR